MAKKANVENPFVGLWNIQSMSAWDKPYLHEEMRAFIDFDGRGSGEFHFGYVHGYLDCRFSERDGKPFVEWTWEGNDEMHDAQGRGWARLERANEINGMIFFHGGDESDFVARRSKAKRTRK